MYQLRQMCHGLSGQTGTLQTGNVFGERPGRDVCKISWYGMCGMWLLQFCLSGKTPADPVYAFYEKNGSG